MLDRFRFVRDSLRAARLWRIYLFMGLQDVRSRFRRSFMGPAWIVVNLALWVGGVGLVYGLMFGQPAAQFLPSLLAGFVVWGFVTASLTDSGQVFVNAQGYIKQFSFPKQIHIFRAFVSACAVFLIGLVVLLMVLLVLGRFTLAGLLAAVPGLILVMLAALGQIATFSYLGVRFRDLPHAMGGMLQVLFLITPIVFPVQILQERGMDFVYQFNPFYYLIEGVRIPLLTGTLADSVIYLFAVGYVAILILAASVVAYRLDSRVVFLL